MSSNKLEVPELIQNFITVTSDKNKDLPYNEGIKPYVDALSILDIQKEEDHPFIQQVKISYIQNLLKAPPSKNFDKMTKIEYHSSINVNELNKLVNLSVFRSVPSTDNLFNEGNNRTCKKSGFLKSKIKYSNNQENEEFSTNNNNSKYNSKPQINYKTSFPSSSGSYMDTRPVYLKRKNNMAYNDEEDDNDESGEPNYSNSIYNINRKKKKKNNNYRNKYNKKDYDEEDEDEDNDYEGNQRQIPQCTGFQSAITITNKVLRNNKVSTDYLKETNNNAEQYNNNCGGGYKKFVPPVKKNSTTAGKSQIQPGNEEPNKDKELDEKLKGFDKKMIEFIESEILTNSPNVNWDDIAGLEFAKKTIKEIIIWPLIRPDVFNGIRKPPKGLLLFGPPGTGKTMIAKAIASQSHSHFFNISASSLMSKWVGESERLVRTLFALASYYQPSVVFIDEIDSILTSRSENECESSRRIKTEFLVQLDGAGTNSDDAILIIGATNRPQEIDDAFIRRLSKRLYIPLPNKASRRQLISNVLKKEREKNNKYDIEEKDIDIIVDLTKGYSGSDMINVCREAAMMPIRSIEDISNLQVEHLRGVNKEDFIISIENVKPSVSDKTIGQYVEWNKEFGSFQFEEKDE